MPDDLPSADDVRYRLALAYERKALKKELRRRDLLQKPPPTPRPPSPHHHIFRSEGRWRVRIGRGIKTVINRRFRTLEEAIAARDHALATGHAPPGRRVGRPRGTKLDREILRLLTEDGL
jgi:hypothetical protein